jgi:hypothetical protein
MQQKSYKQDKRLLKIESDERVTRISTAANYYGDSTMLFKINHELIAEDLDRVNILWPLLSLLGPAATSSVCLLVNTTMLCSLVYDL